MVSKDTFMELKDIKKILSDVRKNIWTENMKIMVKINDCNIDDEKTYDVEVWYETNDGEYEDGFTNCVFYGEPEKARKEAIKRAKTVHSTVKKWFKDIIVEDFIEIYTDKKGDEEYV